MVLAAVCLYTDCKPVEQPRPLVRAVLKGVFTRTHLPEKIILVGIKIIDTASSEIEFLTYTCTSGVNLVFKTSFVAAEVNNCAGNMVTLIKLKPGEEFSYMAICKVQQGCPEEFKLGWIWLNTKNTDDIFALDQKLLQSRKTMQNVIWSNPIYVSCCGGQPYEVHKANLRDGKLLKLY
jgi:hypothetical protein